VLLHIGIDDTDSTRGGCTTYIAARLVETFTQMRIRFIDYPNIIRLNPNVPYKTRGNAAVALRIDLRNESYHSVQEAVLHEVEQNSDLNREGTDPAVVFVKGHPTAKIRQFSRRALWDILQAEDAIRIIRSTGESAAAYGTRLGLVGALAGIGQSLEGDHTFELVAYRTKLNYGNPRQIDENSVKRMDKRTVPGTFNNYDFASKRTLISPHGPDPVLLGIRGENAQIVNRAFRMIMIHEPVERWVIFRTNHGTDAHLQSVPPNRPIEPDRPAVLTGKVSNRPWRIPGGHVFFNLQSRFGEVTCAAFEPTGAFREIVATLLPGDTVTVYGGAKKHHANPSLTINLEKIQIRHLVEKFEAANPTCPSCHKHMKSAGKGQDFRCKNCSTTMPKLGKRITTRPRTLHLGLYLPALKAHRHLTKPLFRYGKEKMWDSRPPSGQWHNP
jgi:tRNA(Ile2)-agmatinylcytidine synthase